MTTACFVFWKVLDEACGRSVKRYADRERKDVMIKAERIFSDRMILQREMPISVWGECEGICGMQVALADVQVEGEITAGRFLAVLPAFPAAVGLTLEIRGVTVSGEEETIRFNDVAVGEVWIAAGQSNMEFPIKYDVEAEEIYRMPEDEELRFFDVPKVCYDGQEQEEGFVDLCFWRHFNRENAGQFSAAALFFARKIREELRVPVGIVGCNWGGTSASCWMGEAYLREYPELAYYPDTYEETLKNLDLNRYREAYYERLRFGNTPRMKALNEAIARGTLEYEKMQELMTNLTPRQKELFSLPAGPLAHTRPCALFERMVKRIAGYGTKGVLWYQGESDEVLPDSYTLLFSQLIRCWRESWGRKLPFLFVQLAPFGRGLTDTGKAFPVLRRQQQRAEDLLEDVWMASIMDHGMEYDIHPKTKRAAGERLALLALGKVYGRKLLCEAPRMADVRWEQEQITIYMAHAGDGLECRSKKPAGLILWEDGVQKEFTAKVMDCRILIRCPELGADSRVQVSYAQQPYVKADLYNSAGLCAKPFVAVRPFEGVME